MRVFCEIIHIITLASMVSVATADCCKSSSTCSAWEVLIGKDCPPNCDDGSNPTPCCGYGNCNAFCCACDGGCRGHRAITAREPQQALLSNKAPDACGYDTTFDEVSGVGSETISLSDYLVWATTYLPATVNNASLIDAWIGYFHSFDANGDGKLTLDEIHQPAAKRGDL